MSNFTPAIFICRCGATAYTPGYVPIGWEQRGRELLCGDCLTGCDAATSPACHGRAA